MLYNHPCATRLSAAAQVINAHAIGCPLDGGAAQGSVPRVWAALCALGVPHALRLIHAASEGA